MNLFAAFVMLWVLVSLSFLAGAAWNADAYDRGYRDGRRES